MVQEPSNLLLRDTGAEAQPPPPRPVEKGTLHGVQWGAGPKFGVQLRLSVAIVRENSEEPD